MGMVRGFVYITEVVLAISIMFAVLGSIQVATAPRYVDVANLPRLHTISSDIAFSVCNNQALRLPLINGSLGGVNFTAAIPADVTYHIYLYGNNTDDSLLDDMMNDSGYLHGNSSIATSSCLTAGWIDPLNASNYVYSPRKIVAEVWNIYE